MAEPTIVYRITWVCARCGNWHRKRGPLGFVIRGAAILLDEGSSCVSIEEEAWAQCKDVDITDWLRDNGVDVGTSDIQWGGFSHPGAA